MNNDPMLVTLGNKTVVCESFFADQESGEMDIAFEKKHKYAVLKVCSNGVEMPKETCAGIPMVRLGLSKFGPVFEQNGFCRCKLHFTPISQRGGKRAGAGRPKTGNVLFKVRIKPKTIRGMKRQAKAQRQKVGALLDDLFG